MDAPGLGVHPQSGGLGVYASAREPREHVGEGPPCRFWGRGGVPVVHEGLLGPCRGGGTKRASTRVMSELHVEICAAERQSEGGGKGGRGDKRVGERVCVERERLGVIRQYQCSSTGLVPAAEGGFGWSRLYPRDERGTRSPRSRAPAPWGGGVAETAAAGRPGWPGSGGEDWRGAARGASVAKATLASVTASSRGGECGGDVMGDLERACAADME